MTPQPASLTPLEPGRSSSRRSQAAVVAASTTLEECVPGVVPPGRRPPLRLRTGNCAAMPRVAERLLGTPSAAHRVPALFQRGRLGFEARLPARTDAAERRSGDGDDQHEVRDGKRGRTHGRGRWYRPLARSGMASTRVRASDMGVTGRRGASRCRLDASHVPIVVDHHPRPHTPAGRGRAEQFRLIATDLESSAPPPLRNRGASTRTRRRMRSRRARPHRRACLRM